MHIYAEDFIKHARKHAATAALNMARCKTICIVSALNVMKSQKAKHANQVSACLTERAVTVSLGYSR